MFSKYSTVIIQIIINAILSRLIDPSVFGLIAIITVFVNFFNILSDMGISSAIIQNKKLTTKDIENIFSFTFYLGFILGFLFILFSFFLAVFYNNKIYINISFILFFSIFFNTINMVPNVIILKNKNFIEMGIRTITISLVVGIITIILTLIGMNYYALILNSVLFSIFIFIWNYSKVKIRFNFKVNFMSLDKIKKHSSFQFAFQVVNYFSRNMDNLLIGKFMSNNQLAYYDKSYKLMLYPIGMVTNVITPIMHPIFSDYQNNQKKFIIAI